MASNQRLDNTVAIKLHKIKLAYAEKYHKSISISDIIDRLLDNDPIIISIKNSVL
jgi:hypothetical protein